MLLRQREPALAVVGGVELEFERSQQLPHDVDVKALTRLAVVYDIPMALNRRTAEILIAQLARDVLSNPEIGGRLFISTRTVQYHLSKVFAKLGITSRSQLDRVQLSS